MARRFQLGNGDHVCANQHSKELVEEFKAGGRKCYFLDSANGNHPLSRKILVHGTNPIFLNKMDKWNNDRIFHICDACLEALIQDKYQIFTLADEDTIKAEDGTFPEGYLITQLNMRYPGEDRLRVLDAIIVEYHSWGSSKLEKKFWDGLFDLVSEEDGVKPFYDEALDLLEKRDAAEPENSLLGSIPTHIVKVGEGHIYVTNNYRHDQLGGNVKGRVRSLTIEAGCYEVLIALFLRDGKEMLDKSFSPLKVTWEDGKIFVAGLLDVRSWECRSFRCLPLILDDMCQFAKKNGFGSTDLYKLIVHEMDR